VTTDQQDFIISTEGNTNTPENDGNVNSINTKD
jgi:hypothetical protein